MNRRLYTLAPLFFLLLSLSACSGERSSAEISVARPAALQALGIVTFVYAVTSVEPERHQELVFDPESNSFKGTVQVPTGSNFDLTVVYEGEEPAKGQRVELEYLTRRGLVAAGSQMTVSYEEASWEQKYEGNATLDIDGDGFGNYAELLYGSDLYSKTSVPTEGAPASASQVDSLTNQSVNLPPPGSVITTSLTGTAEFLVTTLAPGAIQEMTIVSPTYGFTILTPASEILTKKQMRVSVETDRFIVGDQVGTISFTVRVKDRYGLSRETVISFAAFNKEDHKGPSRIRLGLSPNQVLTGAPTFVWELDDPSGIDPASVSVAYNGLPVRATVNDEDPTSKRLLANITLPVTVPNGSQTVIFEAKDVKGNQYRESIPVTVSRSSGSNQRPLIRSLSVSPSSPRTGEPYTISWVSDDPDGSLDIAGYQVEVTDSKTGEAVISCTNFNGLDLRRGVDYSRFCTLKRTGYGESVSFFELAPLSDYTVTVTVRDSLGATGSGSTSFTTGDSSLVGWWRMDDGSGEDARDASDNAANGRLNSFDVVGGWATGIFGKGLLFDGTNDTVSIGDRADWDFQGTDFTISLWVKVRDEGANGSPFISHNAGASANKKWAFLRSGSSGMPAGVVANRLTFYTCYAVVSGSCQEFWVQETSDWTISFNRWYHLVVTRKGSLYSLYRDGVLVGAAESDVVLPRVENSPLVLGASETAFRLNGTLDELSMHKRALSEDEIRQSCRREMPAITSGGGPCPDTKTPIILTPLPGQALSPVPQFWSWRGEKGPDPTQEPRAGNKLLYSDLTYTATFDVDGRLDGVYETSGQSPSGVSATRSSDNTFWYAIDNSSQIAANRGYKLHITPSSGPESVREFTTNGNLCARYKFDDNSATTATVTDSCSGGTYNGSLVGPVSSAGLLDGAISFDRTGDYVSLPPMWFATSDFTASFWINPQNLAGDHHVLLANQTSGNFQFAIDNGGPTGARLNFYGGQDSSTGTSAQVNQSVPLTWDDSGNRWYHLSVARRSGVISFYRDGQKVSVDGSNSNNSNAGLACTVAQGCYLSLGYRYSTGQHPFKGLMDEVGIYGIGMTPSEQCQNYLSVCKNSSSTCNESCISQ